MKYYCNLAYMLAVAILSLGFAACSDDDDYKPAPSVPEDCMQVYFSGRNESEYERAPEERTGTTIDLTVVRLQTAQAASVPVTAFQTGDLFVVPASVEFAAGEDTATLSITLNEAASGEFSLRLAIEDEQYADPYKVVEGSPLFGINVEVVKWNLLGTGDYTYNSVFSGVDPGLDFTRKKALRCIKSRTGAEASNLTSFATKRVTLPSPSSTSAPTTALTAPSTSPRRMPMPRAITMRLPKLTISTAVIS